MVKKKTKKVTKTIKTVVKSVTKPYQLEVKVNDVVFKTKAKSMRVALGDFVSSSEFPFGAKTPLLFTFKKGKIERTRRYFPLPARRLLMAMGHKDTAVDILAEKMTLDLNG